MKKFDSLIIGVLSGLCFPVFSLFVFYLIRYNHVSFMYFIDELLLKHNILTPAISLCVISNLLLFFIFIWTERYKSARGVLLATFMYAGFVTYQKYIA